MAASIALVACGGGGGGGDDTPPGSVDVTAANQDQLARAAAVATQGGFAIGPDLGLSGPLGAGRSGALAAPLVRALQRQAGPDQRALALIGPFIEACQLSGTLSTSLDDRDDSGAASVGDRLTVVFDNCQDMTDEAVDGTFDAVLTEVRLAPSLSFSASVTLAGLRVTLPGARSGVYSGDFTLSMNETSATVLTTQVRVGSQLAAQVSTPRFTDTVTLMAGHTLTLVLDTAALPPGGTEPGLMTTTSQGSVASAAAGGHVSLRSLQPIQQYSQDSAPHSGQIDLAGRNGSLQLTALATGQVRIDLDADGNGVFEQTRTVDWDWLF